MLEANAVRPLGALSEYWYATTAEKLPHGTCGLVHLQGRLDKEKFSIAVHRAIQDYPALTSHLQVVKSGWRRRLVRQPLPVPPSVEMVEARVNPHGYYFNRIRQDVLEHYQQPFDLLHNAPVRMRLLKLSTDEHCFTINTHHVCADGFIVSSFVRQILHEYHHLKTDRVLGAHRKPAIQSARSKRRPPAHPVKNMMAALGESYQRKRHPVLRFTPQKRHLTSEAWQLHHLQFDQQQFRRIRAEAKLMQVSINDLLNIMIIEAIDEVRGGVEGLMAVCVPQNLRRYLQKNQRPSNLASGFYVHLKPEERSSRMNLAENFVRQRLRQLKLGRATFNFSMLKSILRLSRLIPLNRRIGVMRDLAAYPTTFYCSNLGIVEPWPYKDKIAGELEIVNCDTIFPPNKNVDVSLMTLIFQGNLRMTISTYDELVTPDESSRFTERLRRKLLFQ